jgi:hypothetical protein
MSGSKVCPGDAISFTCHTRGSTILDWSSIQYIGELGIQLELTVEDKPGYLRTGNTVTTIATLLSTDTDNDIIVSTLRIRASANMTYPSVTCAHRDSGRSKMLTFQYLGMFKV